MARASSSARCVGEVVAEKYGASVASLQLGTSSRVSSRRARTAVSTEAAAGHGDAVLGARRLEEAEVEGRVVRDQHRARGRTRGTPGSTAPIRGAAATIIEVMPVSTLM